MIHLCVKGMKGRDYSKLKLWFSLLHQYVGTFVGLLEAEKDNLYAVKMAFNVIKCGLLSHNFEIVDNC